MPDGWREGSPEWEAAHEGAEKIAKAMMDTPPKTQADIVSDRRKKYGKQTPDGSLQGE